MKSKKKIIISVISVLALVGGIIAISYAMFTANLTGTKENKLIAGHVALNCTETNFSLENTSCMTDAEGIALGNANTATCTLTSTMSGTMNVGYDIALTNVDALTPNDSVGPGNVKIQVSKKIDSGSATYITGSSANAGVLVSSIQNATGIYDTTGITSYKIDSATITGNHTIVYTIKTWAAADYCNITNTNTNGVCSDTTYTIQATCEAAGEIWGYEQKASQAGGSFSYKLKIGAVQTVA